MALHIRKVVILALVLAVLLCGCAGAPKEFNAGEWDGRTYRNDYFGLSVRVPERWDIVTDGAGQEEMEAVERAGTAAEADIVYLLSVRMYPYEGTSAYPVVQMAARTRKSLPDYVKTEKDYIQAVIAAAQETAVESYAEDVRSISISSKSFTSVQLQLYLEDDEMVYMSVYARFFGDYLLIITSGYLDAQQLEEAKSLIGLIRFD